MKYGSLLFLCLTLGVSGFSQTKKEQKLLDLYQIKNFEKLSKKSKKLLEKDKSNPTANYCMASMYLDRSQLKKTASSRKSYVSKSLRYYRKLDTIEYHNLSTRLHQIIRRNALDSNLKESINNQYRNWLLVYFNDSVPRFKPKVFAAPVPFVDSLKIGDSLRVAMLQTAKKLKGVPYRYGGTSPVTGFDCSGFTQYVYKSAGIELPHNANMQSQISDEIIPLSKLEPGDLVFFGAQKNGKTYAGHAGIIFSKEGNNFSVIHCVNGGVKIEGENSSWDRYWINKVLYGISVDSLANN